MKGKNEIHLNTRTMMGIVQHWLGTVVFRDGQSPEVTDIVTRDDNYATVFVVVVEDRQRTGEVIAKSAKGRQP